MRAGQLDRGQPGEGEVLRHVARESGEGAMDREAEDPKAPVRLRACLARRRRRQKRSTSCPAATRASIWRRSRGSPG